MCGRESQTINIVNGYDAIESAKPLVSEAKVKELFDKIENSQDKAEIKTVSYSKDKYDKKSVFETSENSSIHFWFLVD